MKITIAEKPLLILLFFLLLSACGQVNPDTTDHIIANEDSISEIDEGVVSLMEEYNVTGVGVGFIKNGELVDTKYIGEQSPDIPISSQTMFNVASATKAITAEVFLRLAAKGEVSLDEPISNYYVYADIADDPRHKLLTPRIILTHRTGFKNWPWLYEDEKLAFDYDPGTQFGYSGIGFYILAKFLEEKLWTTFPHLVEETIFNPLGMKNSSIVKESWFEDYSPTPVDNEGNYMEPYDHPVGYWNPADDLHVTVEDYAKFIISSMNNGGLSDELTLEREKIVSDLIADPVWGTDESTTKDFYPTSYGYGLGWMIFDYGDGNKNIQHGGNDEGEASMAYFHTKSKNGLIVFCNGGNAVFMLPKIVELLDEEQKYTSVYNYIFDKFYSN